MDTTQENLTAAITEGDTQLIFVDSPGVVGIKHARYTVRSMGNRLLQGCFLLKIMYKTCIAVGRRGEAEA